MTRKAASVMVFQEVLPFGDLSLTPRVVTIGPKSKAVVNKKPRRKKASTPSQAWAFWTFRVNYDELPSGRHQAIGCGCILTIACERVHFSPCSFHVRGNGFPQFDLPPEWVSRAIEAERDRGVVLPSSL